MPKALVELDGSLLVERAVRTAREVCDVVLVVLGAHGRPALRETLFGSTTREVVERSEAVVFLHP